MHALGAASQALICCFALVFLFACCHKYLLSPLAGGGYGRGCLTSACIASESSQSKQTGLYQRQHGSSVSESEVPCADRVLACFMHLVLTDCAPVAVP